MTELPPNLTENLGQLNTTLANLIPSLRGLANRRERNHEEQSRLTKVNTTAFGRAIGSILELTNVTRLLIEPIKKADAFQKKSLAVGTSLNKFIDLNNETLKGLRGDFFENAEELLKNYSAGLKDNSSGLNKLINRMKLTGQDTEIARQVAIKQLMLTGFNTVALDKLTSENIDLARTYGTTNENLLKAIKGMSPERGLASFTTATDNIGRLSQQLAARFPGMTKEVTDTLKLVFSPENLQSRIMLGIRGLDDTIIQSTADSNTLFQTFVEGLGKANSTLNGLKAQLKGAADQQLQTEILTRQYGGGQAISLSQIAGALDHQEKTAGKLTEKTDGFWKTLETMKKEYESGFYPAALASYDVMNTHLDAIKTGLYGVAAVGAVGGISTMMARRSRAAAAAGGAAAAIGIGGKLLGPVGIIASFLLPAIISKMTQEGPLAAAARAKAAKHLESIDNKITEENKEVSSKAFSMDAWIANNFAKALTNSIKPTDDSDTQEMLRLLRDISGSSKISAMKTGSSFDSP